MATVEELKKEWQNALVNEWGIDNRDSDSFDKWSADWWLARFNAFKVPSEKELRKEWRLFWGEAPEHSLKSRRGYDIEDFWLSKFSAYRAELVSKIEAEPVNTRDYSQKFKKIVVDIIKRNK